MRIFFDSSVLVAAFTFPGVCSKLLSLASANHDLYVSEYVIEEVMPTLRNNFKASENEIAIHEAWLRTHATVLSTVPNIHVVIRDPNDIPILSAAVAAKADILVSGDKDILELENPPLQVMSPRALYDLIMPRG